MDASYPSLPWGLDIKTAFSYIDLNECCMKKYVWEIQDKSESLTHGEGHAIAYILGHSNTAKENSCKRMCLESSCFFLTSYPGPSCHHLLLGSWQWPPKSSACVYNCPLSQHCNQRSIQNMSDHDPPLLKILQWLHVTQTQSPSP